MLHFIIVTMLSFVRTERQRYELKQTAAYEFYYKGKLFPLKKELSPFSRTFRNTQLISQSRSVMNYKSQESAQLHEMTLSDREQQVHYEASSQRRQINPKVIIQRDLQPMLHALKKKKVFQYSKYFQASQPIFCIV